MPTCSNQTNHPSSAMRSPPPTRTRRWTPSTGRSGDPLPAYHGTRKRLLLHWPPGATGVGFGIIGNPPRRRGPPGGGSSRERAYDHPHFGKSVVREKKKVDGFPSPGHDAARLAVRARGHLRGSLQIAEPAAPGTQPGRGTAVVTAALSDQPQVFVCVGLAAPLLPLRAGVGVRTGALPPRLLLHVGPPGAAPLAGSLGHCFPKIRKGPRNSLETWKCAAACWC